MQGLAKHGFKFAHPNVIQLKIVSLTRKNQNNYTNELLTSQDKHSFVTSTAINHTLRFRIN